MPATDYVIYHNPRCSKSRQTLALLQEHGITPTVIDYLATPPSEAELAQLLSLLQVEPREMMRTKESDYQAQQLANTELTQQQLLQAIHQTPKLLERPIVVCGEKAVIGRPPENVLSLIEQ